MPLPRLYSIDPDPHPSGPIHPRACTDEASIPPPRQPAHNPALMAVPHVTKLMRFGPLVTSLYRSPCNPT